MIERKKRRKMSLDRNQIKIDNVSEFIAALVGNNNKTWYY